MPHFVRSGLVALVSLSATTGAFAQAAFMSKAEIQKEIIGKTFSSVTEKGKPMVATFSGSALKLVVDGTFKADGKLSFKDGDVVCLAFQGNPTECNKVRKGSGGFEFVDSTTGKVHNVYKPK